MKIAVLGDWRQRNIHSWGMRKTKNEFQEACYSLGARISEMGYSVIVASESPDTADPYIVKGIVENVKNVNHQNPIIRIHCPISDSPFEDLALAYPHFFSFYPKTQPNWQTTHLVTIKKADIVLIIGGANVAYGAGMATIMFGKTLIPIGSFGGAGERLLNDLESMGNIDDIEMFRSLHNPWSDFVLERTLELIRVEDKSQSNIRQLEKISSSEYQHLKLEKLEGNQIKRKKILFLGANPIETSKIRIDEELRKIDEGLQSSKFRNNFELVSKWAVKMETLAKAMLDNEPQIVHFAGHGKKNGIAVEQDDGTIHIIPLEALKRLFGLFKDKVECVVLSACFSEAQAKVISEHSIYVVGMNDAIGDKAAIDFSVGFYQSVGAGRDYEFAYQMGITLLMSKNTSQANIPVIWKDGEQLEL